MKHNPKSTQTETTTARCGLSHSGNHSLHIITRGFWQCAGCGETYTAKQVENPTDGIIGSGGVIGAAK
jgi:hypothetical protein